MSTTTFGRSFFTCVADLREPVEDVGARQAGRDVPVDAADRLDHGARAGGADDRVAGVITSESPATQSRSFLFGVNATFAGGFATAGFAVGFFVGFVPGFGVTVVGGTTIATSISSASPRPMASWTSPRGRSSRSAWLTCCEAARERERDVALRRRAGR